MLPARPPPRPGGSASALLRSFAKIVGPGRALATVLLLLLLGLRAVDPPLLEGLRLGGFDLLQVRQPRQAPAERPVVILDIDEAGLRQFGQWPWPRTLVASAVRRLFDAGAEVVAFDIVFAEPDRLSPPLLARTLPDLPGEAREALERQPSNDDVLAQVLATGRAVLGQTAAVQPVPWTGDGPPPRTGVAITGQGPDPADVLISFPGLVRNVPSLEAAAAGRGTFTIVPERDGVVRRIPLVVRAEGAVVPSLGLEIARVATGADSILVQAKDGSVEAARLGDFAVPTDERGRVWLRFRPHDPSLYVSAAALLAGQVDAERLRGRIVLVGTSAIGLLDNRTTPIDRSMPGVEIQAQLLENMLTGSLLTYGSRAVAVELAATLVLCGIIIVAAPAMGAFGLLLLGSLVGTILVGIAIHLFGARNWLFDATFPLLATLSVLATIAFTNYLKEQSGRNRIRTAFRHYLSPDLVEQLAQSPDKLVLGGEERRLTVMFSDVRGFTRIAEFYRSDPGGLTQLMNRFLTPLTDAILARRGTIDKYMGDAIMAFWNAPLDDPDHERNAVAAALDMLERMDALNAARKAEAESGGHPVLPLDVGIGLNTGACVVGNMGSEQRFDYSLLGDPVNIASRLEGQSKYYGVKIILGSETADAVREHYALLEIDLLVVKGKSLPETIWTVLGKADLRQDARFQELAARHDSMLSAYRRRDWDETDRWAGACLDMAVSAPVRGLYDLYRRRANAFADSPPPEDWCGVHVADAK